MYTGFSDEVPQADGFAFDARSEKWERIAASPLGPRALPASAWTGHEFLIWGGVADRALRSFLDDGAAYDPESDTWRSLPHAPISARAPLSVWTGEEFIVWGSVIRLADRPRDGASYDPTTNSWRTIAQAPIELTDATAVWTGREMIVFGAALHGGKVPETETAIGAAYDPTTDTWRRLPDSELSPQASTAAWNGREVIAWDYLNQSAAYDPPTDTWRNLARVPLGSGECTPQSAAVRGHVFGDYCGATAIYDPAADEWEDISRRRFVAWGFTLVAADPAVLLLGRNVDTGEELFIAYGHPAWTNDRNADEGLDDVRALVSTFMDRRMTGQGAEQLIVADARDHFETGTLAPLYFDPPMKDFEIVFVDGPLGGPSYEVGVNLIFEQGAYGHTYFVTRRGGRYLIAGGRHGLEGP